VPDNWVEYRRLVLQELERLSSKLDNACDDITNVKNGLSLINQQIIHDKDKWGDDLKDVTDRIGDILKRIDDTRSKSSVDYNDLRSRITKLEDFVKVLGDPKELLKAISDLKHELNIIQVKSGLWGALGASLPVIAGVISVLLSK
jgi:predicted  nucleic acid-binding Zn-ribbon protein